MVGDIKYVHTNLIARNWKKLAQFYVDVFGCEPVYPERDLSGEWIDKVSGIKNVSIKGIHLKLPGFENGPTLEIFEYDPSSQEQNISKINDFGFSHIAFHVENVEELLQKIIENGGTTYGELVEKEYEGIGTLKVVYTRDPEGNIVEIQNWKKI